MEIEEHRQRILEALEGLDWQTTNEISTLVDVGSANVLDTLAKMKGSPIKMKVKQDKRFWMLNGEPYILSKYSSRGRRKSTVSVRENARGALDDVFHENEKYKEVVRKIEVHFKAIVKLINETNL